MGYCVYHGNMLGNIQDIYIYIYLILGVSKNEWKLMKFEAITGWIIGAYLHVICYWYSFAARTLWNPVESRGIPWKPLISQCPLVHLVGGDWNHGIL